MEERIVARGLLVRPDEAVLVFALEDGTLALPGGSVEPGETHEQALARELREELGVDAVTIGPLLWEREHVYERAGRPTLFRERHFLVRVAGDCPAGPGCFVDVRAAARRFAPVELRALVAELLANGVPARPRVIAG